MGKGFPRALVKRVQEMLTPSARIFLGLRSGVLVRHLVSGRARAGGAALVPEADGGHVVSLPPRVRCAIILVCAFLPSLVFPAAAGGASPRWSMDSSPEVDLQAPAQEVAGFDHALTTEDGRIQVMVELVDPPAAVVYAEAMR